MTRSRMYVRMFLVSALLLGLFDASSASARPALFAARVSGSGSGGSGKLMRIDQDTGQAILIGASGFNGLSGLACRPDGIAYGTLDGDGGGATVTIDRADGSGTTLGASGFASITGLASTRAGTLYGSATNATCSDTLVTIDPGTGAATTIGTYGTGIAGMDGLAFDVDGTLYGVTTAACDTAAPGPALYTIDVATGAATLTGRVLASGLPPLGEPTGLEFLPGGALWATTTANNDDLIAIDPTTAAFTIAGDSGTNGELSSLAFCSCDPTPDAAAACNVSAPKGSLGIGDSATNDAKDKLGWKWAKGTAVTADFGDPAIGDTNYALCVYDDVALATSMMVRHGETCGTKPCWQPIKASGFKYANKTGNQDGVVGLTLKEGAGKAQLAFKAKGVSLPTPLLPFASTTGVTVQLFRTDDLPCWEASFATPALTDTPASFKDKTP